VRVSQWATVLLAVLSAAVTFYMDSITGAWKLLIVTGAGTGGVLLLRWYWWRINAWSEVWLYGPGPISGHALAAASSAITSRQRFAERRERHGRRLTDGDGVSFATSDAL